MAPAPARELLDEHDPGREIAVAATPRRGVMEPEEAELAAPAKERIGEMPGGLPLVHERAHLGRDEPADGRAQLLVLGGEDGVVRSRHGRNTLSHLVLRRRPISSS